jgi:hypothetical protein
MNSEVEGYHRHLLEMLREFEENIRNSDNPVLMRVFNDEWFNTVKHSIDDFIKKNQHRKNLCYPTLVGGPFVWFHEQNEFDRLNTAIQKINGITNKRTYLRNKTRLVSKDYRNEITEHQNRWSSIFEILAIGKFIGNSANVAVLEVEFKHNPPSKRNVDAIVEIRGKNVLVEITLIYKNIKKSLIEIREEIYQKTGKDIEIHHDVGTLDIDEMMRVVEEKIAEKTIQIGNVDKPVILIIGLPSFGTDLVTAEWAIKDMFNKEETKNISCVVIAGSFLFRKGHTFYNPNAKHPFQPAEERILNQLF